MPKINVLKPFAFAHGGFDVEEFVLGKADVSDECAAVALAEGWAELLGDPANGGQANGGQANGGQANGGQADAPGTGELPAADFADTQPSKTAAESAAPETAAEPAAPETADAAQQRRRRSAPAA
jgi:hypothetical protein